MTEKTLAGQVAVVTGGSRGIGREIAVTLARRGAKVAVTARQTDKLAETVALIEAVGGQGLAVAMDVTNLNSVRNGFQHITESLGPIDLLVNNAGIGAGGMPMWEQAIDEWWSVIDVNVRGVLNCTHAVLPEMVARQTGRIINIGSYAGIGPSPMSTAYSVSKAALMSMTDNFAAETKEHNIRIFVISPGLVLTDMTRDVEFFKDLPADAWTPIEKGAELCAVLASGQADKLTGRMIHAREDDIHALIDRAEEIIEQDLYTLRLRK